MRNKKNRPQAAILDLKAGGSIPPAGLVAVVDEEQAVVVDEVSDRSDVPGVVHDGELGLGQLPDELQCNRVSEVGFLADDFGEVVGDKNGSGSEVSWMIPLCATPQRQVRSSERIILG